MSTQYHQFTNQNDGKVYFYGSEKRVPVVERTVVDAGVSDKKGRALSWSRACVSVVITPALVSEPKPRFGYVYPIGTSLSYFRALSHQHRAGKMYGGSDIWADGETPEQALAALDKKIATAVKRAKAKFAA